MVRSLKKYIKEKKLMVNVEKIKSNGVQKSRRKVIEWTWMGERVEKVRRRTTLTGRM